MGSRRVSPSAIVAGSLESVGMAEELRFQLEMKKMELEAEERREARRLEIEAANEARRLELEAEARRLALEVEERNEARRVNLEVRRLEVEKHRDFRKNKQEEQTATGLLALTSGKDPGAVYTKILKSLS